MRLRVPRGCDLATRLGFIAGVLSDDLAAEGLFQDGLAEGFAELERGVGLWLVPRLSNLPFQRVELSPMIQGDLSRHKPFSEFFNEAVHGVAEKLVHFAEATLGVEGRMAHPLVSHGLTSETPVASKSAVLRVA